MKTIIDNAAGPSGLTGIALAKLNEPGAILSCIPSTPSEWLIFFSTALVICQLVHWGWRLAKHIKRNWNED